MTFTYVHMNTQTILVLCSLSYVYLFHVVYYDVFIVIRIYYMSCLLYPYQLLYYIPSIHALSVYLFHIPLYTHLIISCCTTIELMLISL